MLQLRPSESLSGADHGWLNAKHPFRGGWRRRIQKGVARLSRGVERTEFKFRGGRPEDLVRRLPKICSVASDGSRKHHIARPPFGGVPLSHQGDRGSGAFGPCIRLRVVLDE